MYSIISYFVTFKTIASGTDSVVGKRFGFSQPVGTIGDLNASTLYEFSVVASNLYGKSTKSNKLQVKTLVGSPGQLVGQES